MSSYRDFLAMSNDELNKLKLPQMKEALEKLGTEANKRYERLRNNRDLGEFPALKFADKNGGFVSKNIDKLTQGLRGDRAKNKVYREVIKAYDFLKMNTSTIKGVKETRRELKRRFENMLGRKVQYKTVDKFFQLYSSLTESGILSEKEYYNDKYSLGVEYERTKNTVVTESQIEALSKRVADQHIDLINKFKDNEHFKALAYRMVLRYAEKDNDEGNPLHYD